MHIHRCIAAGIVAVLCSCGVDFSPTAIDGELGDELKQRLRDGERPLAVVSVDETFRSFFGGSDEITEDMVGSALIAIGFGIVRGRGVPDSVPVYRLDVTIDAWRTERVDVGFSLTKQNPSGYTEVVTSFMATARVSRLFRYESERDAEIRVSREAILQGLERLSVILERPRKFTKPAP